MMILEWTAVGEKEESGARAPYDARARPATAALSVNAAFMLAVIRVNAVSR
jgi:hypothetical protein